MATPLDIGHGNTPFRSLSESYPDTFDYPQTDFRAEPGLSFHRGPLDGLAHVLIIGQDLLHNEDMVRRILAGEAGRRSQGIRATLGVTQSYEMINTFMYSAYGHIGCDKLKTDAAIAKYRNRWIDALLVGTNVEAVVALGTLADCAWQNWKGTLHGQASNVSYQHITQLAEPESSPAGHATQLTEAATAMLANWNTALIALKPAGTPDWMRTQDGWAARAGATTAGKRANITIKVPAGELP